MSAPPAPEDDDDEREWQVTLEDLEGDDPSLRPQEPPIEPGSPNVENVAFVVLGVVLTLYVLFGGF